MADNRYFIIETDIPDWSEILKIIVGTSETQRYSLDGSQVVVKLHKGDLKEYDCLKGVKVKKYTHKQIVPIMRSKEWQEPITLIDNR